MSRWCIWRRPRARGRTAAFEAGERLAERRSRLLAAGLDLLGSDRQDISELTVRGVCRRAGLASRYFYESFADKDEFIGAVFDWVIADLAATTQAAVAAAPAREQNRAAMANIVRTIANDARIGRLLFSTQLANCRASRASAPNPAHCSPCCPASTPAIPCAFRQTTA